MLLELLQKWIYVHKQPKIEKFVLTEMNLGRKKSLFSDGMLYFCKVHPLKLGKISIYLYMVFQTTYARLRHS